MTGIFFLLNSNAFVWINIVIRFAISISNICSILGMMFLSWSHKHFCDDINFHFTNIDMVYSAIIFVTFILIIVLFCVQFIFPCNVARLGKLDFTIISSIFLLCFPRNVARLNEEFNSLIFSSETVTFLSSFSAALKIGRLYIRKTAEYKFSGQP